MSRPPTPPLSLQLSPSQMRPPSCQPPALPCGRPQDQLGNTAAAAPMPHSSLWAFLLSSCTGGGSG